MTNCFQVTHMLGEQQCIETPSLYSPICEDSFFVTDIQTSETMIMLSQVDQALCDKAELGDIHGAGVYHQGTWERDNIRIKLNQQWYPCCYGLPILNCGLSVSTQPIIERTCWDGMVQCINGNPFFNTLFIYLWMSTGSICNNPQYVYSVNELDNAITLKDKFKLSGCWGGQNRISPSNWEEDNTVVNEEADLCFRIYVTDADNVKKHTAVYIINVDRVVILPEMWLRRPEFEARRVFMAPSNIHYPIKHGKGISGVVYVTLSCPSGMIVSDDLILCYPGGAKAVNIADLSLLDRAKEIILLIVSKQGRSGWEFAMQFAARLRREYIKFTIKLLNGNESSELSLEQFRKNLHTQTLIVPEELSDDFGGRLNAFLENKHQDLIPGVLEKGKAMLISGLFSPEVALYLAISVRQGCWDGRWQKCACKVTLFADKYAWGHIEQVKIPAGVDIIAGNTSLTVIKHEVKNSSLVIFASQNMQNAKNHYHELLKFCLDHDISVIVFTEQPDPFVQHIASRFYELNCVLNGETCEYTFGSIETSFGIHFTLTPQGELASLNDLSEAELYQLGIRQNTLPVANGFECIGNLSEEQIRETMFSRSLV